MTQASPATTTAPGTAVLYVCAERSRTAPTLAGERAIAEGRSIARRRGLVLVDTISDTFGIAEPLARDGWKQVRDLAAHGVVSTVITRWPNSLSPQLDYQKAEIAALEEHGVDVVYSWAPLSERGGHDS